MRSRRSFFAITRRSPSSTPLWPIFQASATRIEYCSISSGLVHGSISTASWLLRPQRAGQVGDARLDGRNRHVGARGAGQQRKNQQRGGEKPHRIGLLLRRRLAEIDFRWHGDGLLVLYSEVGLGLVAEHHRRQVGGK